LDANSLQSGRVLDAIQHHNDVVFIYAMAANGERVPLAIYKTTVANLPLSLSLDNSTAMSSDRKLSSAAEVFLMVRMSK
jgi:cytochrome c-type biogenesis protein CcmH